MSISTRILSSIIYRLASNHPWGVVGIHLRFMVLFLHSILIVATIYIWDGYENIVMQAFIQYFITPLWSIIVYVPLGMWVQKLSGGGKGVKILFENYITSFFIFVQLNFAIFCSAWIIFLNITEIPVIAYIFFVEILRNTIFML